MNNNGSYTLFNFDGFIMKEVIVTDRVGGVHDFEILSTCGE